MKKLLRVEDIKIEKGDIGFFAHTPEELGIEGNKLRADTKEELERLIEEAVDRYNEDLTKSAAKQGVLIWRGKKYAAELLKDQFKNDLYHILEKDFYTYEGKFIPTPSTPTPTAAPTTQTKQQPKIIKPGIGYEC